MRDFVTKSIDIFSTVVGYTFAILYLIPYFIISLIRLILALLFFLFCIIVSIPLATVLVIFTILIPERRFIIIKNAESYGLWTTHIFKLILGNKPEESK